MLAALAMKSKSGLEDLNSPNSPIHEAKPPPTSVPDALPTAVPDTAFNGYYTVGWPLATAIVKGILIANGQTPTPDRVEAVLVDAAKKWPEFGTFDGPTIERNLTELMRAPTNGGFYTPANQPTLGGTVIQGGADRPTPSTPSPTPTTQPPILGGTGKPIPVFRPGLIQPTGIQSYRPV